jgi:hypothetical protein
MSQQSPGEGGKRRWNFVSVALFVIGLLILVPSGLCTALIGIISLAEGDPSGITFMLMFGTLPIAVGALLVWLGLSTRQRE